MDRSIFLPPTIFLFLEFKDLTAIQCVSKYWRETSEKRYLASRVYTILVSDVLRSSVKSLPKDLPVHNNYQLICYGLCNLFSVLRRKRKISFDLKINEILLRDLKTLGSSALYHLNPSERAHLLEKKCSHNEEIRNLIRSSDVIKEDIISHYILLYGNDAIRDLPVRPRPTIDQCYSGDLGKDLETKDQKLHIPIYEEPPHQQMSNHDKHVLSIIPGNLEKDLSNDQKRFQEAYDKIDPWIYSRLCARCLSIPICLICHIPRFSTALGCFVCGSCFFVCWEDNLCFWCSLGIIKIDHSLLNSTPWI